MRNVCNHSESLKMAILVLYWFFLNKKASLFCQASYMCSNSKSYNFYCLMPNFCACTNHSADSHNFCQKATKIRNRFDCQDYIANVSHSKASTYRQRQIEKSDKGHTFFFPKP